MPRTAEGKVSCGASHALNAHAHNAHAHNDEFAFDTGWAYWSAPHRYFPDVEIVSRTPGNTIHRYTWQSLFQRAQRLAECLHAAGLKKGDRVATLMWNHYAHLEAHFGVPASGCVLHALNLRLHPDEIAYIANHGQDRFLIVDDVLLPVLEKFKSKVKFERIFVVNHCGEIKHSL